MERPRVARRDSDAHTHGIRLSSVYLFSSRIVGRRLCVDDVRCRCLDSGYFFIGSRSGDTSSNSCSRVQMQLLFFHSSWTLIAVLCRMLR